MSVWSRELTPEEWDDIDRTLARLALDQHLGLVSADGSRFLHAERDPEGFVWAEPSRRAPLNEDYLRSRSGLCQLDPCEHEDGIYRATPRVRIR